MKFKTVDVEEYGGGCSEEEMRSVLKGRRVPLVFRDVELGPCRRLWPSTEYLAGRLKGKPVRVHVSPTGNMSFVEKNFAYKTMEFDDFVGRASRPTNERHFFCPDEVYYLRSVGADRRARQVADIGDHFPEVAADIRLPAVYPAQDFFSSVLRISSAGVRVWTHYDVMDNALIQVVGEKEVVLFDPEEAPRLYLAGDKSRVVDIDDADANADAYPDFVSAVRHVTVLAPGDALFIPALWFHNTLAKTYSVGVNTFWKTLDHSLYDKTDVYANKPPVPASKALSLVDKAIELLCGLPEDYRQFYTRRAVLSLQDSLQRSDTS